MSSRYYPIYRRGNPQLRVFLPNFFMKLVRSKVDHPPNIVHFVVPVQMTQFDVKNYLEKIYRVPVAQVETKIVLGDFKAEKTKRYMIKDDDYRLATVTLPEGCTFKFPTLFPPDKIRKATEDMRKHQQQVDEHERTYQREDPNRQHVPSWFAL
ncbi:39S ribosomal protein L23, mitochondrial-like [Varroa jacobsoni]|uniref:Large ribosomal subunit protein uL23m n=1 Tax=Varroa destructor TaxID=109461 RepID=A0A7M7KW61_VARDE|nr:39S ribosomal protein L23, mitochondrial-like [Varroa destructor]XP_022700541.1 39S ribosomal protein L23, mitochondrial-like [Varroa jacobsoni]